MYDEDEDSNPVPLPYELPTSYKWHQHATFYHPMMAGSIDGTDVVPHDRAIVRAMNAKYKPNKQVKGDPEKTLMVRHLPNQTKEISLRNVFSRHGELQNCRLVRDAISGKSRGYAFVEYKRERDCEEALHDSGDLVIDGQKVVVDRECERTLKGWIPRRFGGGFGGKKESGQLRFGGIERPFRRPIPVNSKPLGRQHSSTESRDGKRRFPSTSDELRYKRTPHDNDKRSRRR